MTFAITNTNVLVRRERWRVMSGVDMVIEGARIAACAPDAARDLANVETLDGRRLLLTPGLVNAHTHSGEALNRGAATQDYLAGWLSVAMPRIDCLSHDDIRLAVGLCVVELLRGGVTSVVDHFRQLPASLDAAETAYAAWGDSGLSVVLALMVRDGINKDGALIDAAHVRTPQGAEEVISLCERWLAQPSTRANVARALGPSAPARCSEAFLRSVASLARRHKAPVHMHVDETGEQAQQAISIFGRSATQTLADAGALGPSTSVVHCVHVGAGDIALLAKTGTTVAHCPVANQRLGSGIAPVRDMLDSGVRVTIGTDGAASNDSQSLPEALKAALFLSRNKEPRERWLAPDEALDMAFQPGPRPQLGNLDELNGRLETGAPADIAAFDLDDPLLNPAAHLPAQLVLSGGGLRARFVWGGGKMLLKDGSPQTVDMAGLMSAAARRLAVEETPHV
jgi:5-methylthioadenosine/S-adenosylhomocysteine deaminase